MLALLAACNAGRPEAPAARLEPPLPAQEAAAEMPRDPAVQVTRFANGVTFVSRAVPALQKGVALALIVRVGSLAENADERGFAHLIEHLAFEGTLHSARSDLAQFQKELGITLGADANATTTHTSTNYLLEVSGDDAAVLDRAVRVLADWAKGVPFDPESVARARSEVLAEERASDNERARLQQRLNELWLTASAYAGRDPIGVHEVIDSAMPEQLARFHRRWYQPQNFIVVANGDFDVAEMRRRVEQQFAPFPRPEHADVLARAELKVSASRELVYIEHAAELPADSVEVGLKRESNGFRTEADYRRGLLDRLVAYLIRRRLAAVAAAADSPLAMADVVLQEGDWGLFDALHLQARAKAAPEPALQSLLTELERISRHGFTPKELALGRTALDRDWTSEWSRRNKLRQQALELARRVAQGDALPSWEQEQALRRRLLDSITLEDLERHGQSWARQSERLLIVVARDAAHKPAESAIRAIATRARESPVASSAADLELPLMTSAPTPGAVVSAQRIEAINAQVWVLANGARVMLESLNSEPGKISFLASSPGGTYRLRGRQLINALVAPSVVGQLGLGERDAATTQRLLYESGVQITPWISDYEEGVRGEGYVANLEELFQALHLTLSRPGHDTAAFEVQKERLRENLAARRASPTEAFEDEISRRLWRNHPRYSILPPQAVEAMDLESMRALYLDRFGDVGDFTFVFVGDVGSDQFEALVRRYLASLPGTARNDAAARPDAHYRSGITHVRLELGTQQQALVKVVFHGDEAAPPSAERELRALASYLELRLREELRERLGGVYGVDVFYALRVPPRQGHEIGFRFECSPAQLRQLEQAAFAVIDDLRSEGMKPSYVDTLRRQLQASNGSLGHSALFWQQQLLAAGRSGRDPATVLEEASRLDHVTSDSLRQAAQRYLRPDQYLEALLLPAPPGHIRTATPKR
jgi:zinc protease